MEVVDLADVSEEELAVHDAHTADPAYTSFICEMTHPEFPVPLGIIKQQSRDTYEDMMIAQIDQAREQRGNDFAALVKGDDFWEIK